MKGFFSQSEIANQAKIEIDIDTLRSHCAKCKLNKNCKSPKMELSGQGKKEILIIGDTPSETDDINSIQFSGNSGEYLSSELKKSKISLNRDCWKVNAVRCHNDEDKDKISSKAKLCSGYIEKILYEKKPKLVLILGSAGLASVFPEFKNREVNRWRNLTIPDEKYDTIFFNTFHPREILIKKFDYNLKSVFERDIKKAISILNVNREDRVDCNKKVEVVTDFNKIINLLERVLNREEIIYFDYETTGLKPYLPGHKIASIGFACSEEKGYAFPFEYNSFWTKTELKVIKELWFKILATKKIKKVAHNCFSGNTKYITKNGLLSFKDTVNTSQHVWTKEGWKKAEIRYYGTDVVHNITVRPFNRSRSTIRNSIQATKNHRWIIERNFQRYKKTNIWRTIKDIPTDSLLIGDKIISELPVYKIDTMSEAFKHGLIFADGSRTSKSKKRNTNAYQIRLCGTKERYKDCFPKYTYPKSANGDPVINHYATNICMKELPINETANYVANFIEGWQLLDGTDNGNNNSRVVTTVYKKEAEWLRDNSSIGGWSCTGFSKHKTSDVGFGKSGTEYYMINITKNSDMGWTVVKNKASKIKQKVYCAEVEDIDEFTLQYGIYTKNCKFEDMWSAILIGVRPMGWTWDTMMSSHIIDNRSMFSGLKFQTFINWGVRPYDEHIKKFLTSTDKSGFNTVMKAPLKELLLYNGLDCVYGFKLFNKHKSMLNGRKGLLNANSFFTHGLITMGSIQLNGIQMDEKYYSDQRQRLMFRVKKLKRQLVNGREAKKFFDHYGRKINITSDQDLGKLFYEVLGHHPIKTAKGNYKTDKDTLAVLNIPFVDKLLKMKRLEKARGTYLGQFAREVFNGEMHPFFDLHIPVTYRSSSSMPNFQNLPKRDEEIKNIIRLGIIPRHNCVIGEIDFSGAEVITSVCYHKDNNFYNYLMDKTTDMHRDNALDLWMLDRSELENPDFTRDQHKKAGKIRFYTKNDWTFAEFYGDWYDSCGRVLWKDSIEQQRLVLPSGKLLVDHINDKGIYDVEQFVEHCKDVENKMWNERFPGYTQWKKDIVKYYQKTGYIETFFGFRFQGYMDRKQCTNYPIQGTSFHLLVYTLIEVEKFIKRNKLKTKIIGQVHDSLISDIPLSELSFYLKGVQDIVTELKDRFKWLIVPMEVEVELSLPREAGGNFSSMYEVSDKEIINFNAAKVYKDALNKNEFTPNQLAQTELLLKKAA